MSVVKLEAFRSLQAHLELNLAALSADRDGRHVKVQQVPPDVKLTFPTLAIVASRFRFEARQEGVAARLDNSTVLVNVGSWSSTVQIRLACATPSDRFGIQEEIEQLFFQREDAPGVLLTAPVSGDLPDDVVFSWDIGDADWLEEYAFSAQEWSVLEVDAVIPALVTRSGVYSMNDLRLGITSDLGLAETSAAFDSLTNKVRVNEDGTVTPLGD